MNYLIAAGILVMAAGPLGTETEWWRTNGGAVVGFDGPKECALFLVNKDHGMVFTWGKTDVKINVQDGSWQFQGQSLPIAVQIGNTWIGNPNALDIPAAGVGQFVTAVLTQPVETLLPTADHVTIKLLTSEVRFATDRSKMPALLDAVRKCRQHYR